MIAGGLVSWAAAQHGDRPSLVFGDQVLSHADVERLSNRWAQALLALGLAPGERVAVLLDNSVHSVASVFGVEKAALTYVALNARHTLAEQLDVLADAEPAAVIVGPAFVSLAQAFADPATTGLPGLRHVLVIGLESGLAGLPAVTGLQSLDTLLAAASDAPPRLSIEPGHVQRIAYTSGTTGRAKGVVYTAERTQQRLHNHFLAMEYGLSVDDAMLHVGPLTHAAGVYLFPCFLRGARNIVLERFEPQALFDAVQRHRATHLMLVPTMMARLVEALEGGLQADLSSLRRIHYGTAPTPVTLIRRALRVFGPILRQQYGMTEAVQPLTVLYPHEHVGDSDDGPLASCGRPTCQVQIELRTADGAPVATGDVGEIVIAHQGIGRVAFWRRPDLLAESVRDGWFHTGDLGRFDALGFLHIVGRNKDMIISGGFNVYAREVEDALASHPAVAEAAVLGRPDAEWGEVVVAFVVLRAAHEADAAALQAHCVARIAGYKKPRHITFVDALPRNAAGKVLKGALRDRALAR
jgi:long-chain acyl-CoA synthetase